MRENIHKILKYSEYYFLLLAVSVMRYSASAFGFAVSNLKCALSEVLHASPWPTNLYAGASGLRGWLADEREHKYTFYGSRFYKQL